MSSTRHGALIRSWTGASSGFEDGCSHAGTALLEQSPFGELVEDITPMTRQHDTPSGLDGVALCR